MPMPWNQASLYALSPRCVCLGGLLLCSLLAGIPARALEGFEATGELDVAAPGWVAVALFDDALRHAAVDLELFGPSGGAVPFRLAASRAADAKSDDPDAPIVGAERGIEARELRATPSGWALIFDLGTDPPRHTRLLFDFERKVAAPRCRLEASDNLKTWSPLAETSLFRLGESGDLGRTTIDYPPTGARYLRLHWPSEAGFPELRRLAVTSLERLARWRRLEGWSCAPRASGLGESRICEIDAPRGARRLDLDIESASPAAYRLERAEDGRWRPLREERLLGGGVQRIALPSGAASDSVADSSLRLEIAGAGAALREIQVLEIGTALLFEARDAGIYTLAWDAATPRRAGVESRPGPVSGRFAWLTPVPRQVAAASVDASPAGSPWPSIAGPAAALPDTPFRGTWPIRPAADGEEFRVGDLVRLELSGAGGDELHGVARADLADLRLALDGHQIPYIPTRSAAPAAAEPKVLRPGAAPLEIALDPALPWTALTLRAPAATFAREVHGTYRGPARPSLDAIHTAAFARTTWACAGASPLPCRLDVELSRPPQTAELLEITLDDGDDLPLTALEVELWRRREALLFVWPEASAGAVTLLAGAAELGSPSYDFATLADLVALRPARAALLGERRAAAAALVLPPWLFPASLALAAAVLLWLLWRMLPPR